MLSTIKNIINEKKLFQEAADIILEDDQLDDDIILGAIENQVAEDGEKKEEENKEADIILGAEIDLRNNTSKDTLPTPPENAGDVIEGETDTQKVDAGFGNDLLDAPVEGEDNHEEEPTGVIPTTPVDGEGEEEHPADDEDLLDAPIDNEGEDKPAEECALTEAISINTEDDKDDLLDAPVDGEAEEKAEENTQEETKEKDTTEEEKEVPADEKNDDVGEEPKEEENPVTSAVKDKVAEVNEDNTNAESNTESKEELFKKLSSLTKGIEDVKASLLKY